MIAAGEIDDLRIAAAAALPPALRAAPAPDPARGDWAAWEELLPTRERARAGREAAMRFATGRGFATVSSALIAHARRIDTAECSSRDLPLAAPSAAASRPGRDVARVIGGARRDCFAGAPLAIEPCRRLARQRGPGHDAPQADLRRQGQGPVRGARARHPRPIFQGRRHRLQQPEARHDHRQGRAQQPDQRIPDDCGSPRSASRRISCAASTCASNWCARSRSSRSRS